MEWRKLIWSEANVELWYPHNKGLSEPSQGAVLELGCLSRGIISWCKEVRPLFPHSCQSLDTAIPGKGHKLVQNGSLLTKAELLAVNIPRSWGNEGGEDVIT